MLEQISEIGGGLIIKSFVSEEKDSKLNPLWDRKPVKLLEDRGDMVTRARMSEQTCSRILDVLEFI